MISLMIALYSLILGVLYAVDTRIFGFQAGEDPFKLTVLCPENGADYCLFNLPGLRQQFRPIKVSRTADSTTWCYSAVFHWDMDAHEAYVAAVRMHGIFEDMQEDGLSYIDFHENDNVAVVDLSTAEELSVDVPQLEAEEAKRLCQELHCL